VILIELRWGEIKPGSLHCASRAFAGSECEDMESARSGRDDSLKCAQRDRFGAGLGCAEARGRNEVYLSTTRGRSVDCVPFLTLFRGSPARRPRQRNVQSFVMWACGPWMRYKLKRLKGFDGRETYTAQLKRTREIEVLEACLLHS
jgi:hypothetical protein